MKRILVRAPNWIGDQVMAFGFFHQLRSAYPKAWITVVCTEWVKDIQYKSLVDEILVLPKFKKTLLNSLKMIFEYSSFLREKGPWGLGILLTQSFGSALLFRFSNVNSLRGYETDMRGIFLDENLSWNPDPSIHRSDSYLELLQSELKNLPATLEIFGQFQPSVHWLGESPLDPPEGPYVVIAPGATADSRRWSGAHFSELIRDIHRHWGMPSVIVGGNAEKKAAAKLISENLPVIDMTSRGSVSSLWKIFKNSKFVVTNESGLAHVASLCGGKVLIVCGAANPSRTKPVGPGPVEVMVNSEVSCWPCEKNTCRFKDERKNRCHEGIKPVAVIERLKGFFHG